MYLEISNRNRFSTRAGGLVQLNMDLTRFYKAHPTLTPVTPLYLSQLRNTQPAYPFLKAKAAQVRHLCEFGLTLALFVASHPPLLESSSKPGFPPQQLSEPYIVSSDCHISQAQLQKYGAAGRAAFKLPRQHRLVERLPEHLDLQIAMFQGMVRYNRSLSDETFNARECKVGALKRHVFVS